jgi:hypothetical protein
MGKRFLVSLEDLAQRLAWGLYRHAGLLGFPKRRPFSLRDCQMVAKQQVEHLRESGVAVDEIYRDEPDLHSSSGPAKDVW